MSGTRAQKFLVLVKKELRFYLDDVNSCRDSHRRQSCRSSSVGAALLQPQPSAFCGQWQECPECIDKMPLLDHHGFFSRGAV
jgi:hypothetical protein